MTETNGEKYERILKDDISKYDMDDISSRGYVVDTLECSLYSLLNSENYEQAVTKAISTETSTYKKSLSLFARGEAFCEVGFLNHINTTGIFMTSCKSCVNGLFRAFIVDTYHLHRI